MKNFEEIYEKAEDYARNCHSDTYFGTNDGEKWYLFSNCETAINSKVKYVFFKGKSGNIYVEQC